MTEKEMKEAGYTEYTKYYKKGDEYKSETNQLNKTSPLNTERLQPGDAGYIGSFWELQDIVKEF